MLCKKPCLCEPRERTRAEIRAHKNMSEGQKRQHMGRMFVILGRYALETNDNAVMTHIARWRPYIRLEKPESKGIAKEYEAMCTYADGVEADLREYERDKNLESLSACAEGDAQT